MSVFKTAQMILFFCRIFGVPYRIIGNKNDWKITSKPIDYLGCVVNIIGQCFTLYLSTVSYVPLSKPKSVVLTQGVLFIFRLQTANGIYSNLVALRHAKKFGILLENLLSIDKELQRLGVPDYAQKEYNYFMTFCLFSMFQFGCMCIMTLVFLKGYVENYIHIIIAQVYTTMILVFLCMYTVNTYMISNRLQICNATFKEYFQTKRFKGSTKKHFINNFERQWTIHQFSGIYSRLIDMNVVCNDRFSYPLVVGILSFVSYYVFTPFIIYKVFLDTTDATQRAFAKVNIIWTIYYTYYFLIMISIGSSTTNHGRRTQFLIYEAMTHTTDENILEKLDMFSLELERQQVVVECEFFRFDWGLVFKMVATSVTFFIVFIQFEIDS